jgi:hypothetical protein
MRRRGFRSGKADGAAGGAGTPQHGELCDAFCDEFTGASGLPPHGSLDRLSALTTDTKQKKK